MSYLEETLAIAFPLVTHNNEMGEGESVPLSQKEKNRTKGVDWSLSSSQEWLWIFVYAWEELPWYQLLENKEETNEEQGTEQLFALFTFKV